MSNTTKALVALGVVAGLGIASLPLGANAAPGVTIVDGTGTDTTTEKFDGNKDGNVSDTVTVRTEIKDTLTLTVTGANDSDIATSGDLFNAGLTDGTESHLVLLGTNGELLNGGNASGTATVNVATNNFGGYKVNMNGETTGFNGKANASQVFADVADNTATFPTTGASVFGYQTTKADTATNITLASGDWNGVKDAATLIATGAAATEAAGDTFQIEFQAHASESQAADIYDEVITITATTNL